jgi:hypothetical protein
VSYESSHLTGGTRLVVQRQMGTGRRFRTVLRLHGRRGSASLPPLAIGAYTLRIAAVRSRRVLASRRASVKVFAAVPFTTLFHKTAEVYVVPTVAFPWVFQRYAPGDTSTGTAGPVFSVTKNPCRSVHVDFIPGSFDGGEDMTGQSGTGSVVQQSRDPIATTVPAQTVGRIDAELVPGQSWAFTGAQLSDISNVDWYVNGSASCYSTSAEYQEP